MQEEMREWRHAARLAVNGSLPSLCVNARLVNGSAPEFISGLNLQLNWLARHERAQAELQQAIEGADVFL
jgi:hypothetical protein